MPVVEPYLDPTRVAPDEKTLEPIDTHRLERTTVDGTPRSRSVRRLDVARCQRTANLLGVAGNAPAEDEGRRDCRVVECDVVGKRPTVACEEKPLAIRTWNPAGGRRRKWTPARAAEPAQMVRLSAALLCAVDDPAGGRHH